FSGRRRHTRLVSDWSSDVCSSDLDDFFLGFRRNAVGSHAGAEFGFDLAHAGLRALESHGTAEVFGFASGEVGGDHGDAQELFLRSEERRVGKEGNSRGWSTASSE